MESQLREQGAQDRMDEVLEEIPRVREDLGFIPLVTPTSQIVGTQAVINIMSGERYKTITKEAAGILKGDYGKTPAAVDATLQERVLEGAKPITCRPADLIDPEIVSIVDEVTDKAAQDNIKLADNTLEDALIYAMFGQVGWKFISNRDNPNAFEAPPVESTNAQQALSVAPSAQVGGVENYSVVVNGTAYHVEVGPSGEVQTTTQTPTSSVGKAVEAPMAGNILKITVSPGQMVKEGDVVIIMEAMKMETEVRARFGGVLGNILVKEGDAVAVGDTLLTLT
jgi:oxaloacetate decarboxylase alpha subunit